MVYKMNNLDICKGCKNTPLDCVIFKKFKIECPCSECLVKMVCIKPCEEWIILLYRAGILR